MLNIGYINYLNSQPHYFGLAHSELTITTYEPKELVFKLLKGSLNFGQISVIEYLKHKDKFDLLDYFCISSSKDRVPSVLLLTKKNIQQLNGSQITLTNKSATSVELLKILIEQKYQLQVQWKTAAVDASSVLNNKHENILLIGDQALLAWQFKQNGELPHWNCYDLANLWFNWTGLPFVFAVFVAEKGLQIPKDILEHLNTTLKTNLEQLDKIIETNSQRGFSEAILREYFSLLDYHLDSVKKQSIKKFEALSLRKT